MDCVLQIPGKAQRLNERFFFFLAATQIAPVYARITPSSFLAVISTCPFGDEATLSIKTTVLLIEKKKEAESIQTNLHNVMTWGSLKKTNEDQQVCIIPKKQ